MARTVAMRAGWAVLSVFVLLVLVFSLVRLTGDPAYYLLPQDAPKVLEDRLRRELALDEALPVQFAVYLGHLARGDLGQSFRSKVPVTDLISQRIPATVTMSAGAILFTIAVGVPLGIYSAYWRGGIVDRIARVVAAIGQSMPSFWLGLLLILVFAIGFRVVPPGGYGEPQHLILPTLTLSFGAIAGLTRLLRSGMIEVLGSDYVLFHRAKGLPERRILWRHALRNAGLTTLSYLGVLTAGLLTGSVLVETVFVWPGIGRLMIEGIGFRDYNVVQGVMLLFGLVYIGVNLLVDVLYAILDPRLR
jgi:ABC-type dipeptide/oligopeptide/nickel transport system permease component